MGGTTLRSTRAIVATVAAVGTIVLAAGCSSSSSSSGSTAASSSSGGSSSSTDFATCSSATACGGMDALVAEAKKEGHLNVITLPADWANYGTIMKDFTAKYGIQITDANPDGTSQDELNAIAQTKGQSRAPDVVDVGTAFAAKGQTAGDWAP
jgi:putative spermidine/putrescine transport system substrate-binding protein